MAKNIFIVFICLPVTMSIYKVRMSWFKSSLKTFLCLEKSQKMTGCPGWRWICHVMKTSDPKMYLLQSWNHPFHHQPFIHPSIFSIPASSWAHGLCESLCESLCQLPLGEGRVTPWTSHQFIAGPHRDRQPFTLTHTHLQIHLTRMFLDCGRKPQIPADTRRTCKRHAGVDIQWSIFPPSEDSLSNQLPSSLEYRNQHQTASCFYEARDESKEGKEGATASVAAASEISVAATLAAVSSAFCDKFLLKKEGNGTQVSSNVWLGSWLLWPRVKTPECLAFSRVSWLRG